MTFRPKDRTAAMAHSPSAGAVRRAVPVCVAPVRHRDGRRHPGSTR